MGGSVSWFVVPVALLGASGIGAGFVVQQHAAAQLPPDFRLSFRLLAVLVQRPLWLAGILAMACGQILGAIALGHGTLALVEPIMATNLLFALPLTAAWHHLTIGRREWIGALVLLLGLALVIVIGDPHGGQVTKLPWPNWAYSGGTIVAVAGMLVAAGRGLPASRQASVLAAAAGMLYGLQDALTQRTIAELSHGVLALFLNWPAFALLVVAIGGMLLAQSAFEAAPLPASLPAMTVAEPITAIAFGLGVYHERVALGAPALVAEVGGIIAMIVGVWVIATSPLIAGGHVATASPGSCCDRPEPRP
jgi:drug/metabolite transporter (DMT)-like permease